MDAEWTGWLVAGGIAAVGIGGAIALTTWVLVRIPGRRAIEAELEADPKVAPLLRIAAKERVALDELKIAAAVLACSAGTPGGRARYARAACGRADARARSAETAEAVAGASAEVGRADDEAGHFRIAEGMYRTAARRASTRGERERLAAAAAEMAEEAAWRERRDEVSMGVDT